MSQQQEPAANGPDRNFAMRSREALQAPAVQQPQQQSESTVRQEESQRIGGQYAAKSSSVAAATNPIASGLAASRSPATQPSEGPNSADQRQNLARSESGARSGASGSANVDFSMRLMPTIRGRTTCTCRECRAVRRGRSAPR